MSRYNGKSTISSTYNVKSYSPLDVRMIVEYQSDLTLDATWTIDNRVRTYNGMLTVVANDTADKCGVYYLQDAGNSGKNDEPDHTNIDNWHKLCELSDISDFVTRLTQIGTELDSIKDRLDALEADSDVETYGYRSGFPKIGEANKLYVAVDENKTYIWFNDNYMTVSGSSEDPEVIFGGSAEE